MVDKDSLGILFAAVLFLMVIQAAYMLLFLPVVRFAMQRKIIALRDDLRAYALEGKIPKDDRGFRVLDGALQERARQDFNISIATVLFYKRTVSQKIQAQEDTKIIEGSDPIIRKIWIESNMLVMAGVVVNSPAWFFVLPILFVLAPISSKAKEFVERIFWNGTNSRNGRGMPGIGGACPA